MKLKNLVPILSVADVAKSIEFYRDALNFEVKDTYEPEGEICWAFLQFEEVELMLEKLEASNYRKYATFYFYPDDLEELHSYLKKRGYPVSEPQVTFYEMKEFGLKDPDGYYLMFAQETAEVSAA
ncbi:MAG: VOC family protein [Coleofasciculaceae cyanobacterium]